MYNFPMFISPQNHVNFLHLRYSYSDPIDLFWECLVYYDDPDLHLTNIDTIKWLIRKNITFTVDVDVQVKKITGMYVELLQFIIKLNERDAMLVKLSI
jgi:hypothetical protein